MRILITGAAGQLGVDLAKHCEASGDDVIACDRNALDLGDRDSVLQVITTTAPDVVVNAGAWTAVDACESDPGRAMRINALGPRWVAMGARLVGAHLVQVSTDYVFDGTKLGPYHEWDRPAPRSEYGRSKLGGEHEALTGCPGAAVVRTSWVCGAHGHNMVRTVLGLLDREELAFVDDQRGCPTFTADLAVGIRQLASSRLPGTYHLTNRGAVSWFELVRDILELAGADPAKVRPITTAQLDPPRPAPRPANSVLSDATWCAAGFDRLPHYRDGLQRLLVELGAAR